MFPALDIYNTDTQTTTNEELPLFKEISIDFNTGAPIMNNGNFIIVEKNEALKVWAWKALNTERYQFAGYSWNYGSEFESLITMGLSPEAMEEELKRQAEEVLKSNPNITGVKSIDFEVDGAKVTFSFSLITIYGEEESTS